MEINIEDFDSLYEKKDQLLVVDFFAEWCGPCKQVGPIVSSLSDEYGDRADIKKINVDNNRDLAVKFGVRNIPTILFFKNGEIVDKVVGAVSKSRLEEMVENHL